MMASEPKPMEAKIKDPQHFGRVADSVKLFNVRQDLMDVCFVCARGHRVFAHKLLICSVSTQMKKMFLALPDNIDLITIHLPDIEARILRLLFDFLYEGTLRVVKTDYMEFKELMSLLGIVLHRSTPSEKVNQPQSEQPPSSQPQQPIQSQAVFYMQAPAPNSQGQMQYVLTTPATMSQGQVMQVAQTAVPGQVMQVPQTTAPGQMMQVAQATAQGQVMQVAAPATSMPQGQMMQMAPAIMSQANGQMVQGNPQMVTTQIQQNNVVQAVPQTQVMPQIVQCSSQMVAQGSQATMINSHVQGNIQNQVAQPTQRPQYVMTCTANQMTTGRARTQYTQPQTTPQQRIMARSRVANQAAQPVRTNAINSVRTRRVMRAPVPLAQNRSLTATRTIQRSRHSAQ